jgi:hypothetical protein
MRTVGLLMHHLMTSSGRKVHPSRAAHDPLLVHRTYAVVNLQKGNAKRSRKPDTAGKKKARVVSRPAASAFATPGCCPCHRPTRVPLGFCRGRRPIAPMRSDSHWIGQLRDKGHTARRSVVNRSQQGSSDDSDPSVGRPDALAAPLPRTRRRSTHGCTKRRPAAAPEAGSRPNSQRLQQRAFGPSRRPRRELTWVATPLRSSNGRLDPGVHRLPQDIPR